MLVMEDQQILPGKVMSLVCRVVLVFKAAEILQLTEGQETAVYVDYSKTFIMYFIFTWF